MTQPTKVGTSIVVVTKTGNNHWFSKSFGSSFLDLEDGNNDEVSDTGTILSKRYDVYNLIILSPLSSPFIDMSCLYPLRGGGLLWLVENDGISILKMGFDDTPFVPKNRTCCTVRYVRLSVCRIARLLQNQRETKKWARKEKIFDHFFFFLW